MLCVCLCMVDGAESAVNADVQGRSERVSQVRHLGAAERAPSGSVL